MLRCLRPVRCSASRVFLRYSATSNVPVANVSSTFLTGENAAYVEEMYASWQQNPASVHKSWDVFFRTGSYQAPPTLTADYNGSAASSSAAPSSASAKTNYETAKLLQLIRAFQVRGHMLAKIDPLGLLPARPEHTDLELSHYGFSEADLDRVMDLSGLSADVKGFLDRERSPSTLRHIYQRLQETYCGSIGYEYMHIASVEKCNWIREKIETREQFKWSREQKIKILDRLTWADNFENFLAKKFTSAKRFGLEGAETVIPGMKALFYRSAELGLDAAVLGMPHRGRLNVLSNVVRKPIEQILFEFEGKDPEGDAERIGSGDVKYHLGFSFDRVSGSHKKLVHISLLANPSHLEAVNPVVAGKTKAKQHYLKDDDQSRVMSILMHGDAAFAGQGICYETMQLAGLSNYGTGGTVHIVVNNQVGFTTDPTDSRSTPYCTDLAKAFNAPIFHINGDDPEAVCYAFTLAAEWRARFKSDVVLDIVCYRKYGHNEIDEPAFTQPLMYNVIRSHKSALQLYQDKLLSEGITKAEIEAISSKVNTYLENAYSHVKTWKPKTSDWLGTGSAWDGLKTPNEYSPPQKTGVDLEVLKKIGQQLCHLPSDFTLHPRLKMIMEKKLESLTSGHGIDWGTAEALAFGSILLEGNHVRLSGQDVGRGTFSHRHAVLTDQKIAQRKYTPLANLDPKQAPITISNSPLSEFSVLGFELGYSQENPHALVLWEAQFGDFFNGAQIIVDQFLSSMEEKWFRQAGLVMLLPHGYEGQGPEHSSARLERFLQMSNDHPNVLPDPSNSKQIQKSNWQIVNCTTAANYFHVLRRQLNRQFRKPLLVFSPKSLLRLPAASSSMKEMATGTSFQTVIPEADPKVIQNASKVRRNIFCTGKVYHELVEARSKSKDADQIAITRLEQISPFPFYKVAEEIARFPNAELVWTQEEPMNMGAWTYVRPRFETATGQINKKAATPRYIGRDPSAATATGYHATHSKQQQALLSQSVNL